MEKIKMSTVNGNEKTTTMTRAATKRPSRTTTCPICLEEIKEEECIRVSNCYHGSCMTCWKKFVESQESSGKDVPICFMAGCRVPLIGQRRIIGGGAEKAQRGDFLEFILGRPYQAKQLYQGITNNNGSNDNNDDGSGSNNNAAAVDEFTAHYLETNTKKCKGCGAFIFKDGGCDKMQCLCGYRFCFSCGNEGARCPCDGRFHDFWDNGIIPRDLQGNPILSAERRSASQRRRRRPQLTGLHRRLVTALRDRLRRDRLSFRERRRARQQQQQNGADAAAGGAANLIQMDEDEMPLMNDPFRHSLSPSALALAEDALASSALALGSTERREVSNVVALEAEMNRLRSRLAARRQEQVSSRSLGAQPSHQWELQETIQRHEQDQSLVQDLGHSRRLTCQILQQHRLLEDQLLLQQQERMLMASLAPRMQPPPPESPLVPPAAAAVPRHDANNNGDMSSQAKKRKIIQRIIQNDIDEAVAIYHVELATGSPPSWASELGFYLRSFVRHMERDTIEALFPGVFGSSNNNINNNQGTGGAGGAHHLDLVGNDPAANPAGPFVIPI